MRVRGRPPSRKRFLRPRSELPDNPTHAADISASFPRRNAPFCPRFPAFLGLLPRPSPQSAVFPPGCAPGTREKSETPARFAPKAPELPTFRPFPARPRLYPSLRKARHAPQTAPENGFRPGHGQPGSLRAEARGRPTPGALSARVSGASLRDEDRALAHLQGLGKPDCRSRLFRFAVGKSVPQGGIKSLNPIFRRPRPSRS